MVHDLFGLRSTICTSPLQQLAHFMLQVTCAVSDEPASAIAIVTHLQVNPGLPPDPGGFGCIQQEVAHCLTSGKLHRDCTKFAGELLLCANLDLNVYSLATGTSERLVNHDARIWHRVALALGACSQEKRPHGRRQAEAVCLHIRSTQLRIREVNSMPVAAFQSVHSLSKNKTALHAWVSADIGATFHSATVGCSCVC